MLDLNKYTFLLFNSTNISFNHHFMLIFLERYSEVATKNALVFVTSFFVFNVLTCFSVTIHVIIFHFFKKVFYWVQPI